MQPFTLKSTGPALLLLVLASWGSTATARDIACHLDYNLSGWSLIYKQTSGKGMVSCSNGQRMAVKISAKALGLTAGKWRIDHGRGRFSGVRSIDEVLGSYVQASANAGAVKSKEAQVLSKGEVSLALTGGGDGVNLGVDIGKFTIKRR